MVGEKVVACGLCTSGGGGVVVVFVGGGGEVPVCLVSVFDVGILPVSLIVTFYHAPPGFFLLSSLLFSLLSSLPLWQVCAFKSPPNFQISLCVLPRAKFFKRV